MVICIYIFFSKMNKNIYVQTCRHMFWSPACVEMFWGFEMSFLWWGQSCLMPSRIPACSGSIKCNLRLACVLCVLVYHRLCWSPFIRFFCLDQITFAIAAPLWGRHKTCKTSMCAYIFFVTIVAWSSANSQHFSCLRLLFKPLKKIIQATQ